MDIERIRTEIIANGRDTRYSSRAYEFVLRGLEYAHARDGQRRHLHGNELSEHIATFATLQFGPAAQDTLAGLNIRETADIGSIVYNMINLGLIRKRPEDSQDDFTDVFSLAERLSTAQPSSLDRDSLRTVHGA